MANELFEPKHWQSNDRMRVVACDIGKQGCYVCVDIKNDPSMEMTVFDYMRMPIKRDGDINVERINSWIDRLSPDLYVQERPHGVGGGSKGALTAIFNAGRCLTASELVFPLPMIHQVSPRTWQSVVKKWVTDPFDGTKDMSFKFAKQNNVDVPTLTPKGKKLHDGFADAFAIACWAMSRIGDGRYDRWK